MKMRVLAAVAVAIPLAFGTSGLMAQGQSDIHVPDSSVEHPGERGQKAHTNHVISLRGAKPEPGKGHGGNPPPPPTPAGKSPAQIRSAYGVPSTGGSGIIAIVDAYHYPTALTDFNTFATQWTLPKETSTNATSASNKVFQVVYASGVKPTTNCGWAQESALDIEWAHAMAPNAKIVLVEAASNSFNDLMQAVDAAENLGASQISMSWGGNEFSTETNFDGYFDKTNLTYWAASGDTGGKTIYPGVSQFVVAAGGTSLKQVNGQWQETGWSGSGGGRSQYVITPSYQLSALGATIDLQGKRGVPDFSFDADPATGVAVYDSTSCQGLVGWMVFGGTSASSPALAGITNLAHAVNGFNPQTQNELDVLYSHYKDAAIFNDVVGGSAGSFTATTDWDFVTGLGSNKGTIGK